MNRLLVICLAASAAALAQGAFAATPSGDDASLCRDNMGMPNERLAACNRVIRGKPERPELAQAYIARAQAQAGMNKPGQAIKDYAQALDLEPGDPVARSARGMLRFRMRDSHQALAEFDAAEA